MNRSQLLKGVLDLAVLATLREVDGYGYEILRRLRESGLEEVADASVYGTLRRLYKAGLLASYVGPSTEGPYRKYYSLNERGREQLADSVDTWERFVNSMTRLVEGPDERDKPRRSGAGVRAGAAGRSRRPAAQ